MEDNNIINNDGMQEREKEEKILYEIGSAETKKENEKVKQRAIKAIEKCDSFVLVDCNDTGVAERTTEVISLVGASMGNHTAKSIVRAFQKWMYQFKEMSKKGMEEHEKRGGDDE